MEYQVGQPVVVYAGSGKDRRHEGIITKVGRKLVTIEWPPWTNSTLVEIRQFRMEDQRENLPPNRTYAGASSFRTLEQDAQAERKHAAENAFVRLGLHKNRANALTLDEMEAVVRLLDEMRS